MTILDGATASVLGLEMQGVEGDVKAEVRRYLDGLAKCGYQCNINKKS